MPNIKLVISYDGTEYHGFQVQPDGIRTIQGVLEETITALTGEAVRLIGAGRTDSGVHALAQVVNFHTTSPIPVERWPIALNNKLPQDIRVLKAEEVPADFHARYSARAKSYRYLIGVAPLPNPLLMRYTWWVGQPLDVPKMAEAAAHFLGKQDFTSFQTAGSSAQTAVRTVYQSQFRVLSGFAGLLEPEAPDAGQIVAYDITADGFVYNMVRNIVGLLYRVGLGLIEPAEVPGIIEAKDRSAVGRLAPPQGLWLTKVWY
ncbi:MAG: tRNA pseudouridine(38-40) synthase TruA [Firmicutes bacterium]|nr:tRNA pseudouridine(38-40) synthase TruA [Bacillota bacterium]